MGDNVVRVLHVGLESQKWGWQLDYEWFYTYERVCCLFWRWSSQRQCRVL